ncbi:hypothetical protein HOH11_00370 [Candidatus Woesearchaeota archaeon]|jgi:hypothetical protein|nr:hypothetical protein [Candidatus Woesearchaeota archaeon]MBT6023047.1 hypothetical protein [Candidatus Woesearchaeota archaeon]
MLKDLFGTILGRRESMYKFIYYHTFGRLILTYVLFAVGYSLIKLIDTYVVVQYIPQINFLAFYLPSLNLLTYIIIALAMLLAAIAIIVFVLAKLFRKQVNFGQLFLAMQSIMLFFLIIKLMYSLAILTSKIYAVTVMFYFLFLFSILYFIFIIAKTASFFTTFNLLQSSLIMLLIIAGIIGLVYGLYIQLTANLNLPDLLNQTYIESNNYAAQNVETQIL